MTMESKRAVIYARYSSSRQREESIERQIEICNDYAVAHNMLVIGSYVDRKKTGKTDTRPDFQRMIYESSKHLCVTMYLPAVRTAGLSGCNISCGSPRTVPTYWRRRCGQTRLQAPMLRGTVSPQGGAVFL